MQLTSGRDVEDGPAWSPGGRWLAFSRTSRDSKVTSVSGWRTRRSTETVVARRMVAEVVAGRASHRRSSKRSQLRSILHASPRVVDGQVRAGREPRLALAGAWEGDS